MREMCWYCTKRPSDPSSAQKILLHRDSVERTVAVPVCSECDRLVGRAGLWSLLPGLIGFLIAVGAGIGGSAWIADLADRNLTELSNDVVGWSLFAGIALLTGFFGLVMSRRTVSQAGLGEKWSLWKGARHPEIIRLERDGWKQGPKPKPQPAAGSTRLTGKSCGRCGKDVALTAHTGDRCPHCGALWSYERQRVQV